MLSNWGSVSVIIWIEWSVGAAGQKQKCWLRVILKSSSSLSDENVKFKNGNEDIYLNLSQKRGKTSAENNIFVFSVAWNRIRPNVFPKSIPVTEEESVMFW